MGKYGDEMKETTWKLGMNFFVPWIDLVVDVSELDIMEMKRKIQGGASQRGGSEESYEKVAKSDEGSSAEVAFRKNYNK